MSTTFFFSKFWLQRECGKVQKDKTCDKKLVFHVQAVDVDPNFNLTEIAEVVAVFHHLSTKS